MNLGRPRAPSLVAASVAASLAALVTMASTAACARPPLARSPLDGAAQLVVVTTGGWDATDGTLRRYARDRHGAWRAVGKAEPVVVGRAGLAWGRGVHRAQGGAAPVKREGDGRAPAGVFHLGTAFGDLPPAQAGPLRLPYHQSLADTECVDDARSTHYNQLVERGRVAKPDWSSSEHMLAVGPAYHLGVVVRHNADPPAPGDGSCIFLHRWSGPGDGTAGCTALAAAPLDELVRWLDPAARPLLVQLPESEYRRLASIWSLPPFPFR